MRTRSTAVAVAAAAAVVIPLAALAGSSAPASAAANTGQVCDVLSTGHLYPKERTDLVVATAPAGKAITGYCVKAGSPQQGNGPVTVRLASPGTEVPIQHPSGKDISHYSLLYGTLVAPPTPSAPATPGSPSAPTTPAPTTPAPTTPAPTTPAPDEDAVVIEDPVLVEAPENDPATDASGGFDWNWRYSDPSCYSLFVAYPSNIPAGQSNDVNVRVWTDAAGVVTLNYHDDETTWSGNRQFVYSQHRSWPAGVREYAVVWTQVAGSNYHYGEEFHQEPAKAPLTCRIDDDGDPVTYDVPAAVSDIEGWRTAVLSVRKGAAAPAARVTVEQPGLQTVALQRQTGGAWSTLRRITPGSRTTTVPFPQERRKGTSRYRLVLPASGSTTGATTSALTVRVR